MDVVLLIDFSVPPYFVNVVVCKKITTNEPNVTGIVVRISYFKHIISSVSNLLSSFAQ